MATRSHRNAIRWAREIPTMLHGGRLDRVAHHVVLLIATWADNDGKNAYMSLDALVQYGHVGLAELHEVLGRLEKRGYIIPAVAEHGAAGWVLPVDRKHEPDTIADTRAAKRRAATAKRTREWREAKRVTQDNGVTVTPDSSVTVTQKSSVTTGSVTQKTTVTGGSVTQDCDAGDASGSVTPAGQRPVPPVTSIKNYLHKDACAERPPAAVAAETDPDASNGALFGAAPSKPTKAPAPDFTDDFNAWWALYPRKADRKPALIAYEKARLGKAVRDNKKRRPVSAEQLLRATPMFAAQMRQEGREAKHIPMGATWLNKDGWEDYGPAEAPQRPTVDHLRATADAAEAARLLRTHYLDPGQHPNDPTPHGQFVRAARVAFIDQHADELDAILTKQAAS